MQKYSQNSLRFILGRTAQAEYQDRGIKVWQTPNINEEATLQFLVTLDLDLILNLRTRNIYKKAVLKIPRKGCINIHHGVLPEYRGTMCDLWALSEGRNPGFSIHWMNEKIDDGHLIQVTELSDYTSKDYSELPYISSLEETKELLSIIDRLEQGDEVQGKPNQSEKKYSHSKNPTRIQIREMKAKGILL